MATKQNPFSLEEKDISALSILESRLERERKQKVSTKAARGVLIALGITYVVCGLLVGLGLVKGNSMHPTLEDGDFFVYWRLEASYEVGDIVVFEYEPGDLRVKRVVGLEGDVLTLTRSGELLVNGSAPTTEVFYETSAVKGGLEFPYTVSRGEVVLMGDKRDTSLDSREMGAVLIDKVKGKLLFFLRADVK